MNPEHKRIVELAAGWEGSDADVTVSPSDALLLKSVGAKLKAGKLPTDPSSIKGQDLFAAAEGLRHTFAETPEGAEATPNQQSVTGPGTDPDPNDANAGPDADTPPDDGLDGMTVAELKDVAAGEDVKVPAHAKKDEIIAAVRAARTGSK